jgi:lysophospholipase L1-like esterase
MATRFRRRSAFKRIFAVLISFTILLFWRASAEDTPATSPPATRQFLIQDVPRPVLFFGDDATEQRMYTTLIETYTLSRFPSWKVPFRNTGWQGDTIRFTGGRAKSGDQGIRRDIESFHPQIILVNYGINDAGRGDAGFQQFSVGTNVLSRDMPRVGVYRAVFTSSNPAEGYEDGKPAGNSLNLTLQKFADEMKTRFPIGWLDGVNAVQKHPKGPVVPQIGDGIFVDLFDPMLGLIESGRKAGVLGQDGMLGDKTERLVPDGLHPNWSGHLIMATLILQAMHAPALVSSATLDAATHTTTAAEDCTIAWQSSASDTVQFQRTDEALPWPISPDCDLALKLPGFDPATTLNQYNFKVVGLQADAYELLIDDQPIASYSKEVLANGINLGFVKKGPIYDQGQKLLQAVVDKNDTFYQRWHDVEIGPQPNAKTGRADLDAAGTAELARLDKLIADQEAAIDGLRVPTPHVFKLVPANKTDLGGSPAADHDRIHRREAATDRLSRPCSSVTW